MSAARGDGVQGFGILERAESCGLGRVATDLAKLARSSIRLRTRAVPSDEAIPVGASKIGGKPDVPTDFVWPSWDVEPQAFLAQVRLLDVVPLDPLGLLPRAGLLSFFYDVQQRTWGYEATDRGSWHVAWFPEEAKDLVRMACPKEGCYEPRSVTFEPSVTLPDYDAPELEALTLTDAEADAYFSLCETFSEGNAVTRMLGYAQVIQNDMLPDLPRVTGEQASADWLLLLQLDEESANMQWGCGGRLYFWVPRDALVARTFARTWLRLQCT